MDRATEVNRLHWEMEAFFKTGSGLEDFKARSPHFIYTLIEAVLVRHSVAMQAKRLADNSLPKGRRIHTEQRAWVCALAVPEVVAQLCWPNLHLCDLRSSSYVHLAMASDRRRAPLRYAVQRKPSPEHRLNA